jgi:cytochrome c oxidase subunit III
MALAWNGACGMSEINETKKLAATSHLVVNINGPASTIWWGVVLLILIEATFFAGLIASYFYLRFHAGVWPIGNISPPDLVLPIITAIVLFASSAPMVWASRSIQKGDIRSTKIGLALSIALAIIFLGLKVVEYGGYDYDWTTNAYGSIVWTITGFHAAHVLGVILKFLVVLVATFKGHFDTHRNLGIRVNALYWHFVVAVWAPLFFTLYLSHYLL